MDGALHIHQGVLYVGLHAKTAQVRSFDLDGNPLETHFSFKDPETGRSSVCGLTVDQDHRVWVADAAAARLRAFTLVGREIATVEGNQRERAGLGRPSDVCSRGEDDELIITVASSGRRRHAVHELHPASGRMHSLRPLGDPEGHFADVCDLSQEGDLLYVCERRARRVQVFRAGAFHYSIALAGLAPRSEPCAVAPAGGGRLLVAFTGRNERAASGLVLLASSGKLLRVIAESERLDSELEGPCDVAVEAAASDRQTRVAVLDRAAQRLQIFSLEGRCFGAFVQGRSQPPELGSEHSV